MATITSDILDIIANAKKPLTATQVSHEVGVPASTTSSIMYKLMKKGVFKRIPCFGPRGGYGYTFNFDTRTL